MSIKHFFNVTVFLMLTFCKVGSAQEFSSPEIEQMYQQATTTLSKGNYNEALAILQRIDLMEPKNTFVKRSLAQAYQLSGAYQSSLNVHNELIQLNIADAESFRVATQAYIGLKEDKKAQKVLQDAINQFPEKGGLYYDLGNTYKSQKNYEIALKYWVEGIKNDPNFHLNYYEAAIAYVQSEEPLWAIIYAEIFINKEWQTKRSEDIRILLLDAYQKFYFTPLKQSKIQKTNLQSEVKSFEEAVHNTLSSLFFVVNDGINTENLIMLRTRFIIDWYNKYNSTYPFSLFQQHDSYLRNGNFEAYNQWLFGKTENPTQYESWANSFDKKIKSFQQYKTQHPLKLTLQDSYNDRKNFKGIIPEKVSKGEKR
jgi:tetratricopeptide (TPR) repeat protein